MGQPCVSHTENLGGNGGGGGVIVKNLKTTRIRRWIPTVFSIFNIDVFIHSFYEYIFKGPGWLLRALR